MRGGIACPGLSRPLIQDNFLFRPGEFASHPKSSLPLKSYLEGLRVTAFYQSPARNGAATLTDGERIESETPPHFIPGQPVSVQSRDIGVISLALDRWSNNWKSRHQILTRLAKHFQVTWLNPAPEWRSALRSGRFRVRETTPSGLPMSFVVHESSLFTPVVHRPRLLGDALFNARLRSARAALHQRGCRRIVLYIWHVEFAKALDLVPHDWSVYHIYDEHTHAEVEQPLDGTEYALIRSVDQVIAVSPTMFERKGALNPNRVLLSNGVDYEAFAQAVAEPEDLRNIRRPRVGYAGVVKRQLDWELISSLAARRPDWSFVFAGGRAPHPDIAETLERLARLPNVTFLGMKSVDELARYPQHFDVCTMPYRENDYTKYIYPLKLHEYLASGQPVVSIPLPALAGLEPYVTMVRGVDAWERAIEASLVDGVDSGKRAARQAEARRHDWLTIADAIAALIRRGLGERRTKS